MLTHRDGPFLLNVVVVYHGYGGKRVLPMLPTIAQTVPDITINGEGLKWACKERDLARVDAARLLGISDHELATYESGAKKPNVTFLRRVSSPYEISSACSCLSRFRQFRSCTTSELSVNNNRGT